MLTSEQAIGLAIILTIFFTCYIALSVMFAVFLGRVIAIGSRRRPSKPSESLD